MFLGQVYERADAFLFGRRTYEIFAGFWGTWADPGDSPIWTALNARPKYVASANLTNPRWADTTVLSGDLATGCSLWRRLAARPGGNRTSCGLYVARCRQSRPWCSQPRCV